jgi:hypothetical protein
VANRQEDNKEFSLKKPLLMYFIFNDHMFSLCAYSKHQIHSFTIENGTYHDS